MTTTEREIAAEIRRLVREELRVEESFADAEELAARLDSLLLLALVTAVEDRFRVILSEEDAAATRSLVDLARLVARKTAAAPPEPDVVPPASPVQPPATAVPTAVPDVGFPVRTPGTPVTPVPDVATPVPDVGEEP